MNLKNSHFTHIPDKTNDVISKPLIIITKRSILDAAVVLDPPLNTVHFRGMCVRYIYNTLHNNLEFCKILLLVDDI